MATRSRLFIPLAVFVVVVSACGAGAEPGGTESAPAATASPSGQAAGDTTSEETAAGNEDGQGATATSGSGATADSAAPESQDEPSGPSGDPAPDFQLALANGSTFSPSAEAKPIYMVFWAEW